MDKKQLGINIKESRKTLRMTSEQLAEKCNINATYLRQIESGVKIPSLPLFDTICQALEVSPSLLLSSPVYDYPLDFQEFASLWKKASSKQQALILDFSRLILEKY